MSVGEVFEYDFGQKNHWRRWVWNRISERVENKRDAVCIFLAGAQGHDFKQAIRRGFAKHNLISVERSKSAVRSIRNAGILCVDGDFNSAVTAFLLTRQPAVVFGDFCGPVPPFFDLMLVTWLRHLNAGNTVFAFNFLRGRDARLNVIRTQLQQFIQARNGDSIPRNLRFLTEEEKHRGQLLMFMFSMAFGASSCEVIRSADGTPCSIDMRVDVEGCILGGEHVSGMRPVYASYKSTSGQVFDSVVFKNILGLVNEKNRTTARGAHECLVASTKEKKSAKTALSVRAVLAHRTIRKDKLEI